MMPNKFNIGDKVIIKRMDRRTPAFILDTIRLDHPRTITATFYDNQTQHTRYYLGSNNRGNVDLSYIDFRAEQLKPWQRGNIGRPKKKRRYRRRANIQ